MDAQVLFSVVTIFGSGVAAYVGVRVALAEMRKDIEYLYKGDVDIINRVDREGKEIRIRLDRLEKPFFRGE